MEQRGFKTSGLSFSLLMIALSVLGTLGLTFAASTPRFEPRIGDQAESTGSTPVDGGRADVWVSTVVGAEPGYRDGAAWEARFSGPNALAVEADGSLLISDSRNHRIRRWRPQGRVETVAGGGETIGSGGKALGTVREARFRYPSGVAVDPAGAIYVADTGNHRICRVQGGTVTLFAGGSPGLRDGVGAEAAFNSPAALSLGPDGALWVADLGNKQRRRIDLKTRVVSSPAQTPAAVVTELGDVAAPAVHPKVALWASGNESRERYDTLLGRRSPGCRITLEPAVDTDFEGVVGYGLVAPSRLSGTMELFADPDFHVVMAVRAPEYPMVLAGRRQGSQGVIGSRDGTGATATFSLPAAVVCSPSGLYVADYEGNKIRRVQLPGWVLRRALPPLVTLR